MSSRSPFTVASVYSFSFGNCRRLCAASRLISERALAIVAAGLSRATP
jgi:hypothetical protein